jgi:pentatricopeptide repeat protein
LPPETLNLLVRLLSKFNHPEQALKYYEMMKERGLKLKTTQALNSLLEVLLKNERESLANSIFEFHLESLEDNS